jgi:hypothetical protein
MCQLQASLCLNTTELQLRSMVDVHACRVHSAVGLLQGTHHSMPHARHVTAICLDGLQCTHSKSAWRLQCTPTRYLADCAMSRTLASSFVRWMQLQRNSNRWTAGVAGWLESTPHTAGAASPLLPVCHPWRALQQTGSASCMQYVISEYGALQRSAVPVRQVHLMFSSPDSSLQHTCEMPGQPLVMLLCVFLAPSLSPHASCAAQGVDMR